MERLHSLPTLYSHLQTAQLGRELLGSNGLLGEFLVSKALADMEGVHSYEGTYVSWVVGVREFEGGRCACMSDAVTKVVNICFQRRVYFTHAC